MNNDFDKVIYEPFEYNNQIFYDIRHPIKQRLIYRNAIIDTPYGLDFDYDKYNIKCRLNLKDNDSIDIYNYIKRIEIRNMKFLELNENQYKSALYIQRNKNKPLFKSMILTKNKKPYIDITFENDKEAKTIFDLETRSRISCDLIMGNVWKNSKARKNKGGMTIYISNIHVLLENTENTTHSNLNNINKF